MALYLSNEGGLEVQSSSTGRGKTMHDNDVTKFMVCMTYVPISRCTGKLTLVRSGPFSQVLSHMLLNLDPSVIIVDEGVSASCRNWNEGDGVVHPTWKVSKEEGSALAIQVNYPTYQEAELFL